MDSNWLSVWRSEHKFEWNWKLALMRVLVNGASIAIIALLLPGVRIPTPTILNLLILGVAIGVLNALIKPIISFLTLSFIFVTFGLVVIIINASMILILEFFFPTIFMVNNIWTALLAGLLLGLVGTLLESLMGLTPPIIDDTPTHQTFTPQPTPPGGSDEAQ
jgi:putative membrane protein